MIKAAILSAIIATPAIGAVAFDESYPVVLTEDSTYIGELGYVTVREATEFRQYDSEPMYEADTFGRISYFRAGEEYCSSKIGKFVRCDSAPSDLAISSDTAEPRITWAQAGSGEPTPAPWAPLPHGGFEWAPLPQPGPWCVCGGGGHHSGGGELPSVSIPGAGLLLASSISVFLFKRRKK